MEMYDDGVYNDSLVYKDEVNVEEMLNNILNGDGE